MSRPDGPDETNDVVQDRQLDQSSIGGATKPASAAKPRTHRRLAAAWLAGALVALATAIALLVVRGKGGERPQPRPTPVNVITRVIEPLAQMPDVLRVDGVVEANRVVDVAAEIAGRLETYAAKGDKPPKPGEPIPTARTISGPIIGEGDVVHAGEPLLYLNTDLIQARYDSAKAQYEHDLKEYERIADARKRGVATPTEFDAAVTRLAISKASFEAATATLERATIVAPIDGVVDQLPVDPGEYVHVGQIVAKIVDIDRVKVVAHISEADIHYLKLADQAVVSIDSLGGLKVYGRITYISELADELTRTTRIEITVDNPPNASGVRNLRSGQIVKVELTRRVLHDVIMIPLSAVIPLENGYVVYVVEDGKAQRRNVKLGLIKGHYVRILQGLAAGDRLIVAGHHYVGPGQQVVERKEQ